MKVKNKMNNFPFYTNNLIVSFNQKNVVDNISISIKKGDIFGLIGVNGAGKTTIIRSSLGLIKSNSEALFFGNQITSKIARNCYFYLPEKFIPSPQLKGIEYLRITMQYFNMRLDLEKAISLNEELGLKKEYLFKKISSYSKGMAQKLGLSSALLSNKDLLVLDEPMSGLDPLSRVKFKDSLKNYCSRNDKSVFFSSHVLADIEEICTNIGVLHQGKIIFSGTPKEFILKNNAENLERAFLKSVSQ